MEIKNLGSGEKGAMAAARKLECDHIGDDPADQFGDDKPVVRMIQLPRFGGEKLDLDDYLMDGWLELLPPLDWQAKARTYLEEQDPDGDDPW